MLSSLSNLNDHFKEEKNLKKHEKSKEIYTLKISRIVINRS